MVAHPGTVASPDMVAHLRTVASTDTAAYPDIAASRDTVAYPGYITGFVVCGSYLHVPPAQGPPDEAPLRVSPTAPLGVSHVLSSAAYCNLEVAQIKLPRKYDGFPYSDDEVGEGSIMVEAFLDPLCPDSKDSWSPLKQALHYYSPNVSLIVHPFPLPYHSNSYIASRALHIANKINSSTTFPLLELFFRFQEKYYNDQTLNMTRASIINDITNLAILAVGNSSLPAFKDGFKDPETNTAQIISFKYGCSRGVASTPTFLVNGFALPGAGAAMEYTQWRSIIDPLLS
ncbi:hypothetical protein J5N97_024790 [Dioscorea zingiberensis]|uniref:Thioredoxin-like fold domain-containing protein n=1 Tax=Dioscorea zingiberensis TaxID=325984 RepID=A0A9D5C7X3_9LILI|nr:hypothetical protein J5N97_024790 [Dioscorea zingiberensis]